MKIADNIFSIFILTLGLVDAANASQVMRARNLGIPFEGTPGKLNAIVDVPGVEVGHKTILRDGERSTVNSGAVRTGITAIFPKGKKLTFVPANWFSFHGNGELTGTTWIEESGFLEGPIVLTNTYSVGTARDAVRKWAHKKFPNSDPEADDAVMLPVIGETWDGLLNDINGFHVRESDVMQALDVANTKDVQEGSVGGGTGMVCFQFKCGIGTSSRQVSIDGRKYLVGVLVQANFGRRSELRMGGRTVALHFQDDMPDVIKPSAKLNRAAQSDVKDGSIIGIVATDAPLLPQQLKRLAKRMTIGMGLTGGVGHNSSGDLFLAFSTSVPQTKNKLETWAVLPNAATDEIIKATIQATEESIANALVAGKTMVGVGGQRVFGISHEKIKKLFAP